ncbi:hypothetical protein PENSPDRAFT_642878 [Peniophora sp. CONT]|nr:hypothetical protein PENSPDRAFT_642878 [Peniophora sp. CONT]
MSATNPVNALNELATTLSRLNTTEEKVEAALALMDQLSKQHPAPIGNLNSHGGHTKNPLPTPARLFDQDALTGLLAQHGLSPAVFLKHSRSAGYALDQAPCAFINHTSGEECKNIGTKTCSECMLVKYCSSECQKKHWRLHKQDCRDSIRLKSWKPAWEEEARRPTFVTGNPRSEPLSKGIALWGNMPAIDVLNIPKNAIQLDSHVHIAFPASGDIRNVVKTVNSLPEDFTGKLTVVLNDIDSLVSIRNALLLTILGDPEVDSRRAADVALHLWYSAFLPMEYHIDIIQHSSKFATHEGGPQRIALGSRSSLETFVKTGVREYAGAFSLGADFYDAGQATNELARVRFDPSRVDLHHRIYCRLEPSHRLSLNEFRRFGLVLPLGAHNAHFSTPNSFLFSPRCELLLSDFSSPLNGWNVEEVIKSGIAHGTTREDVYGCLYFHVSDALREFSSRLSRFHVDFKLFQGDALSLASRIRDGKLVSAGLPASTRFDRIDVSNVMDSNYAGVAPVIKAWGPLLRKSPTSTMLGYFMNWPNPPYYTGPDSERSKQIIEELERAGRVCSPNDVHAYTDTLQSFENFLTACGLKKALREAGLQRKTVHTIVPPRMFVPTAAPFNTLPKFSDESWYWQVGNTS